MRSVFQVSLEWSSAIQPHPGGKRLDVLKRLLTRMIQGQAASFELHCDLQVAFGKGLKITSANGRELANNTHAWIRFCSVPTVPSESLKTALRFFSAYIERSTHFFARCPPTKYENDSERTL